MSGKGNGKDTFERRIVSVGVRGLSVVKKLSCKHEIETKCIFGEQDRLAQQLQSVVGATTVCEFCEAESQEKGQEQ